MNQTLLHAEHGSVTPDPITPEYTPPRPAGNSVADVADLLLFRARDRLRRGEWNGAVVLLEVCIDIVESVDDGIEDAVEEGVGDGVVDEGLERLAEAG